jgi:hypothetical protein
MKDKIQLPKISIISGLASLACLLLLHFLSPEFEPNWRMVSEYALGKYSFVVSLFFTFWGLSSITLAVSLWKIASNKKGKSGVVLLLISGIGAGLASYFDVSQNTGHGIAGLLGIPTVPIASLLIAYHLAKKEEWLPYVMPIKWIAHLTWISLLLMVATMIILMNGFQSAGVVFGPDSPQPTSVPDGVIAVVGYANRFLIFVDILWLIVVARSYLKISNR